MFSCWGTAFWLLQIDWLATKAGEMHLILGQVSLQPLGRHLQILLHYWGWFFFLSAFFFSVAVVNCSLYKLPTDIPGFLRGKGDYDPYIEE